MDGVGISARLGLKDLAVFVIVIEKDGEKTRRKSHRGSLNMKRYQFLALFALVISGVGTTYACGMHGLYSFGSPIYIPKCIKTDGSEGFCSEAMSSSIAKENKLALTTDIPKTSIISNSNEEIRDAIENGATCVLNSECATGTKCVKHRGLYGVCK